MDIYLITIISVILIYTFIINIAIEKINLKELIFILIITLGTSLYVANIAEYLKLIPIVILASIYVYMNTRKVLYSICITIFSTIVAIIVDYGLGGIYTYFYSSKLVDGDFGLDFIIMELVVVWFLSKFIGKVLSKSKIKVTDLIFNFRFLIVLIVILTLIFVKIYTSVNYDDIALHKENFLKINGLLFFILCTFVLAVTYIIFKGMGKEMEVKGKEINYELLQNYTDKLENLYGEMRAFKHDYANIISSMIGYIEEDDMEGLKRYFNKNILPLSQEIGKNNLKIALLKNIKVLEVKGLLSSKLIRAQEMGIDIDIDIKNPIEKVHMDIIDLTRVLGILLDNAIEAGEKNHNPTMKVGFIREDKALTIIISNSCQDEIPPVYKMNKKGYSTKGENRGMGLSNLKDILGGYEYITLETIIEDGEFIQKIIIEDNFS